MAMATTTAMTVMAVTAAAGAAMTAASAIQQGKQAAQQASVQAQIMQQQADREREIGAANEEDYRREQSRLMASRRAILGGSGVESDTGSPLFVAEDMAGESELQALRIRNGGDVEAARMEQQADFVRLKGAHEQSNSYLRAGGSLLSGAGNVASAYGGYGRRVP